RSGDRPVGPRSHRPGRRDLYTPVLFSDQMKTALRNEVAKALQGKESPQQALDNAVNAADRLLRQG
ncbi:hypothetical protein ACWD4N_43335, partial [Streptomyces sp. NPDC002586]